MLWSALTEAFFSSLFLECYGFNHRAYNQINKKSVSKIPRLLENISQREIFWFDVGSCYIILV